MKLEFEGDARGGLRVVSSIPFARIGQLRGLNGTGKSLALRLAQLCANPEGNPYLANPDSWLSLRDNLGDGYSVRALDPESDEVVVEWRLQPSGWPQSPAKFAYEDIGDVYIHGTKVPVADYAAEPLIEVVLLVGNESVLDVLEHMVAGDAERFRVQGAVVRDVLESALIEFEQLHDLLEGAQPDALDELRRELEEAKTIITALQRELEEARAHRQALADLRDEEGRLAAAEEAVPQLLNTRNRLGRRVTKMQKLEASLDGEIRAALEMRAELRQLEGQLNHWQQLHSKRIQFYAKSSAVAETLTREAELPGDFASVTEVEVQTRQQLGGLVQEHSLVLRSVPLLALVRQILEILDATEVNDEIEVLADESGSVTLRRLRAGLKQRRGELEGMDQAAREKELASAIAETNTRLEAIVRTRDAIEDRDRKLKNLREAEAQLAELVGQIDASSPLGRLTKERAGVRDLLAEATVELEQTQARLESLTSGRDLALWKGEVDEARRQLGLSASIDHELSQADTEVGRRAHELVEFEEKLTSIEQALEFAKQQAKDAAHEFKQRRLDWIDVADPVRVAQALDLIGTLRERTSRQGLMIAAFASSMRELAHDLGSMGRGGNWPDDPPTRALLKHYGDRLGQLFSEDAMREALLEGGVLEAVDLWQRTVRYLVDGEPRQRPLEAFSSGEMVFAYTRSRLALLDPPTEGRHRIVALDEFGAFLDQEKRDLLVRFLANEIVGKTADQIILVLPAVDLADLNNEQVRFDAISGIP